MLPKQETQTAMAVVAAFLDMCIHHVLQTYCLWHLGRHMYFRLPPESVATRTVQNLSSCMTIICLQALAASPARNMHWKRSPPWRVQHCGVLEQHCHCIQGTHETHEYETYGSRSHSTMHFQNTQPASYMVVCVIGVGSRQRQRSCGCGKNMTSIGDQRTRLRQTTSCHRMHLWKGSALDV